VYPLSRVHIHQELADARVGVVEVLVFVQGHLFFLQRAHEALDVTVLGGTT
jgi:hypothetical protein